MAHIILNEADPIRRRLLSTRLKHSGHTVSSADRLDEIISILSESPIDIILVDMDKLSLEDVLIFAPNLRGAKLLLQASNVDLKHDFRSWIADDIVHKSQDGENVLLSIDKVLTEDYKQIMTH